MPSLYRSVIRPAVFLFDAETMHNAALRAGEIAGKYGPLRQLVRDLYYRPDPALSVKLGRVTYPSPAGLAAGYDKYGQLLNIMPHISAGHMEFGTITPLEGTGNQKKRCFRLPRDSAMINRMGLNNYGLVKSAAIVAGRTFDIPVNVNLDPNVFFVEDNQQEDAGDMVEARKVLWLVPYAKTINVSCPNTEDGKAYESPDRLDALLGRTDRMNNEMPRDVYVKFPHDLSDDKLCDLIGVAEDHDVAGYVIGNTSNSREDLKTSAREIEMIGKGGLSGRPLMLKKLHMVRFVRDRVGNEKVIIGSGGIGCGRDAHPAFDTFRYLDNGADTVQVLTGVPYSGPSIFKDIVEGLPQILENEGYGSLEEFRKRRG